MDTENSIFYEKGIKVKHNDHIGYIYNSNLKCEHNGSRLNLVDHNLDHQIDECNKIEHRHSINESAEMIKHLDHYDYIIGNRLHHIHEDHCDDHGRIERIRDDIIEEIVIKPTIKHLWKFYFMIMLVSSFFLVELITGIIIESLALQADSFHMLSDLIALIIATYSYILSFKTNTDNATYGLVRAEVLGGLINGIFLVSSCFFILLESVHRFIEFREIGETLGDEIDTLLIVGSLGLGVNIMGMFIFHSHHNHDHNKNIKALIMHVAGDALGSVGVIISGIIIKYTKSDYRFLADPIISLMIVSIILVNAVPLVRECYDILIHRVPKNININELENEIYKLAGIQNIHHFHVWQLNDLRIIGTMHIIIDKYIDIKKTINSIEEILHKSKIHSTTIQIEISDKRNMNCQNIICNDTCSNLNCC